jgi:hypothetical protein
VGRLDLGDRGEDARLDAKARPAARHVLTSWRGPRQIGRDRTPVRTDG